jgi:hypothetical protein
MHNASFRSIRHSVTQVPSYCHDVVIQQTLTKRDGPKLCDHLLDLDPGMDLISPPELWVLISEYAVTTVQDDLDNHCQGLINIRH